MTDVFSTDYSRVYDALYEDKDYAGEAQYICDLLRANEPGCASVLEFGCGTGHHSRLIAQRGFNVLGVDRSDSMLKHSQVEQAERVEYLSGDIREVVLGRKFDAVISVFHVISYLSSNKDVLLTFRNARAHLRAGGLFLFDFWYGPAVLTLRPESRLKIVQKGDLEIYRFSDTALFINDNLAEVSYTLVATDRATGRISRVRETHAMRYLFMPELSLLLDMAGFEIISGHEWLTNKCLSDTTWNGCILARAL